MRRMKRDYNIDLDILTVHRKLQESILRDIARRLAKTDFSLTDTADWQAEKLKNSGMLYSEITEEIAKTTKKQKSEIESVFKKLADEKDGEEGAEINFSVGKLSNLSPAFAKTLDAAMSKTCTTAKNLTKTTAITSQTAYIMSADLAHQQVISGAFDYGTAIRNAVVAAASQGVTVIYPSGHRSELSAAMRRAVLTGANQTAGKAAEMWAKELDGDLMELTAHAGARPEHAVWQGKIVSLSGKKGYLSTADIGYGDVRGFMGANCRHNWFPFDELSERSYSDEELEEMKNATVEIDGEKIPLYKATERQRAYERGVRGTKCELVALDEAIKHTPDGAEKDKLKLEFHNQSVKLKAREARLADFCKKTGLDRDRYREQVFAADTERKLGFGKSVSGKAVQAAKKHYSDFVAVVGKSNAPATLDKYYELKYNNPEKFKELRELYKGIESGKYVLNAVGHPVEIVKHINPLNGKPNSITQTVTARGGINRNFYDENGRQYKQLSNNGHDEAQKVKKYGNKGEHVHDYLYTEEKIIRRERSLTELERKENADIL